MPTRRNPLSAPIILFMSVHSRSASMASGTSRGSRPILRHQPQLRLDCSAAMSPFSHSTTLTPSRARKNAVQTPMMPPPMMTTVARAGRSRSDGTGSSAGGGIFARMDQSGEGGLSEMAGAIAMCAGAKRAAAGEVGLAGAGVAVRFVYFTKEDLRIGYFTMEDLRTGK